MKINVNIFQGAQDNLPHSDVNIIIDVIRAFTVSHHAFLSGADKVKLLDTIDSGINYKNTRSNCILSGEVGAFKIDEFDFGNSPYDIANMDLSGKVLGQKTTSGVSVTLKSLKADRVYVTGFTNYVATVEAVKNLVTQCGHDIFTVNIIASHESGDEDLACAELIKECILSDKKSTKSQEEAVVSRIFSSDAAKKFFNPLDEHFSIMDLALCVNPIGSNFVMTVEEKEKKLPVIRKRSVP